MNPTWQSLAAGTTSLRPRLLIAPADHPAEAAADRIAEEIASPRHPATPSGLPTPPIRWRPDPTEPASQGAGVEGPALRSAPPAGPGVPGVAPPLVTKVLESAGEPLDPVTRSYFEPRFGLQLSGVRLHTDARANAAARAVAARAFTVGEHIVFAAGQHAAHRESGRRLLAHELAHVAQQASVGPNGGLLQRKPDDGTAVCVEPPALDIATVELPSSECMIDRRGLTIWTARLWDFSRDETSLTPCHSAAIALLVSDAETFAAQNPEIIGWSVTSITGHASPEGEEDHNESLALGRAASVHEEIGATTARSPLFQGASQPVSGGEACSEGAPRSDYPYHRAVDLVIEFAGESAVPLSAPTTGPPEKVDPRVTEDLGKVGVSHELGNPPAPSAAELALGLPSSELAFLQGLDEDRRAVMGWLRQYANEIQMQEFKRGVDRRAIAGAIAWEALVNVRTSAHLTRGSGGPGKIHVQSSIGPDMRSAAPAEVEERGLIPAQTYEERLRLLQTPTGAIDYIGAIMQAMAQDAEAEGFDIWRDPAVLTWGYHSKYVDTFRERMEEKAEAGETTFDTSPSAMAVWTAGNLHYLELCVGKPTPRNSGPVPPSLEPLPGGPTP